MLFSNDTSSSAVSSIYLQNRLCNEVATSMGTHATLAGQISALSRVDMLECNIADCDEVKAWGAPITQPAKLANTFLMFANDPQGL